MILKTNYKLNQKRPADSFLPSFGFKRKITRIFDVNKSLQVYDPLPKWAFGHDLFGISLSKEISAKFTWKYNIIDHCIDLYATCRSAEVTAITKFQQRLEIGKNYELSLYNTKDSDYYTFSISDMEGRVLDHITLRKVKNNKRFWKFIKPKLHRSNTVESDIIITLIRMIKL